MDVKMLSRNARAAEAARLRIRKAGRNPNGDALWTEQEDQIIRENYPGIKGLCKKLPGRTYYAIRSRTQHLKVARSKKLWLASEVSKLRRIFPNSSRSDLEQAFPAFKLKRIESKIRRLKLRRTKTFSKTGFSIIDEIRLRCQYLNYSMGDLDNLARTGTYFQKAAWLGDKTWSVKNVCKAIKALDGDVKPVWRH